MLVVALVLLGLVALVVGFVIDFNREGDGFPMLIATLICWLLAAGISLWRIL